MVNESVSPAGPLKFAPLADLVAVQLMARNATSVRSCVLASRVSADSHVPSTGLLTLRLRALDRRALDLRAGQGSSLGHDSLTSDSIRLDLLLTSQRLLLVFGIEMRAVGNLFWSHQASVDRATKVLTGIVTTHSASANNSEPDGVSDHTRVAIVVSRIVQPLLGVHGKLDYLCLELLLADLGGAGRLELHAAPVGSASGAEQRRPVVLDAVRLVDGTTKSTAATTDGPGVLPITTTLVTGRAHLVVVALGRLSAATSVDAADRAVGRTGVLDVATGGSGVTTRATPAECHQ